jgi:hypothetical protein
LLDEQYVLFALGLLAQSEPVKALRLMRKYVVPLAAERRPTAPVGAKAEVRERSGKHVPV